MIPELLTETGQEIDFGTYLLPAPIYKNANAEYHHEDAKEACHQISKVHRRGATLTTMRLMEGSTDSFMRLPFYPVLIPEKL